MLADLITKVGIDTRDFEKKLDQAGRKMERQGRRMSIVGNDLTNNISLPLAAMGGFAIKAAADIERLELALKNAMGAGYADELERLAEAAKAPGLGFEQAVRGSVALQAVGASAEYAREIMVQWGNAVAAAGGTSVELGRVVTQLQQALSKQGNLLREDWKFIIQAAPQAQKALVDLYGTGDLESIAKTGVTAKMAIAAVTAELAKLGRVQPGIAEEFVNFRDELKRALVPLGKAIFDSADLTKVMKMLVDSATKTAKAFGNLSPGMQKFIVQASVGVIAFGPFLRLMGSSLLIVKQFRMLIGRTAIQGAKFTAWLKKVGTVNEMFNDTILRSYFSMNKLLKVAGSATSVFAGLSAMVYGAVNAFRGINKEIKEGAGQLETLRKYQGIGVGAYNFQIAQGQDRTAPDPKKFAGTAKSIGLVNGQLSIMYDKTSEVIPKFVQLMNVEPTIPDPGPISEWGKALQELNKEMRGIEQMGILTGKGIKYQKADAIWDAISEGVKKLGMSADDPRIQNLIGDLKEIRGVVQGVAKEIPSLSKLPAALSPTGGIPDLGQASLTRATKGLGLMDDVTKASNIGFSFKNLDNAIVEGMATMQQATLKVYDKYGKEAAKAYQDGFSQRIKESGRVLIDVGSFMRELGSVAAVGIADAFGNMLGGENPAKSMIDSFLIPLTDVIRQFGVLVIASANLSQALKAAFTNPITAIAVGGAAIIAASAAKKFFQSRLTSLAEGGIATGPTPALVGDNPRSPELITPLHKLPELMRGIIGSGGGTVRLVGEWKMNGRDLTYYVDQEMDLRKSISMY